MPADGEGKQELPQIYEQRTLLLMDAVPEPNPTLWRDEAGPSTPPFLFLDSVGFGPVSVSLTGETLGEQTQGASSHSHTHLDGKCVLAG